MLNLDSARAFVDSYDHASQAGDPFALADHYGEPYVSFSLGHTGSFPNREAARAQMVPWMERFRKFGLDNVKLVDCQLVPVSETFCLCHLTFEIAPRSGDAPWRFLNIYGMRQDESGQRFEFSISDNEIASLLARYPGFMADVALA